MLIGVQLDVDSPDDLGVLAVALDAAADSLSNRATDQAVDADRSDKRPAGTDARIRRTLATSATMRRAAEALRRSQAAAPLTVTVGHTFAGPGPISGVPVEAFAGPDTPGPSTGQTVADVPEHAPPTPPAGSTLDLLVDDDGELDSAFADRSLTLEGSP